ncbi:MAG: alkaline phosphatase family protein [Candidatus Obscuribacterales bacterium]|nr:alkaline phosphatase family protein [Candidatus Obscuribacterales bacterium]
MLKRLFLAFLFVCLLGAPAWALERADHVFIISFDGGKPTVMQESKMPTLQAELKHAAYTWHAQTIVPSLTLPSHTSMLTGVKPDKHHILWNDWEPLRGLVKVPTIFALAKEKKLSTAMFAAKPKFNHFNVPNTLDNFTIPAYESKTVAKAAADYIINHKPNLCFIHFADSDGAGHAYGWGTPEQKQAFADEDEALKTVLDAVSKANIQDSSVLLLTADHGGHLKTHGTEMPDDMNIPWIAIGKGVKQNFEIKDPVFTCDTAATALWLLDVPLPANFDGKPVKSAFADKSDAKSIEKSAEKTSGSTSKKYSKEKAATHH